MDPFVIETVSSIGKEITRTSGFWEGFGWLVAPDAMARAKKAQALGETDAKIESQVRIEEAISSGRINCPPGSSPELMTRAFTTAAHQMVVGQINREAIAQEAFQMLPPELQDSPPKLDEDFAMRFFRCAEHISTEDGHKLWAALLAGKLQRPDSISLRVLDVMRNLSSQEAMLFKSYTKYLFAGCIFIDGLMGISPPEQLIRDWNTLEQAGLVKEAAWTQGITFPASETINLITVAGAFFIQNTGGKAFTISGHPLTEAGRALASLDSLRPDFAEIIKCFPDSVRDDIRWGQQ